MDGVVFVCVWRADDEGDLGVFASPGFFAFSVDACVVACLAGGSEVAWVIPWAALGDGNYVVDLGGGGGAFGADDLAGVCVAFEDGFSDSLPWAGVDVASGFVHWLLR